MQRQRHGEQAHWMMVTLASMLGQIGLPGGGFGLVIIIPTEVCECNRRNIERDFGDLRR